jgi:succinate-acetate transporter protein
MEASANPAPGPFGDPTALGLLGLSIGCASLLPIAFGQIPSEPARAAAMFATASWFCLLFGAGGQLLAGLMSLANKNTLGGTLLTTFSFNWVMNWWVLSEASQGRLADPAVGFAVDCTFLLIFVVLTYAFGFYSKLLFVFLVDIDVLYVVRITRHLLGAESGAASALGLGVGVATVALMAIALYIAFALLVNPAAGRAVFPTSGPMFTPAKPAT